MFQSGTRGSQSHKLGEVKILNAKSLENTKFACYIDINMQPHSMLTNYDEIKQTLTLSLDDEEPEGLMFNEFTAIHYGAAGDLNLCDIQSF